MAKSGWPTVAEVTSALAGLGVSAVPGGISLGEEVLGAVSELERSSGDSPWLAGASETVVFEHPGGWTMDLGGAWAEVSGVEVDGDVWPGDAWAAGPGGRAPFRTLRSRSVAVAPGSVVRVTGRRGVSTVVPEDVWGAVRDFACVRAVRAVESALGSGGEVREVRQDSVTVKYAGSAAGSGLRLSERLESGSRRVFRSMGSGGFGGSGWD